jgi:hypothetical protein
MTAPNSTPAPSEGAMKAAEAMKLNRWLRDGVAVEQAAYMIDRHTSAPALLEEKWTKDWPDVPGFYWYYGQRFRDGPKGTWLVEAFKTGNENATLVGAGHFWYRSEHDGFWMLATLPAPPANDAALCAQSKDGGR